MRNMIELELTDATTYATIYLGLDPIGTVMRKRMYGDNDRKRWTVYDLNGAELFQTNLGRLSIISRLAGILKAKAPTIEQMEELAAVVHQEHYDARGDRYATADELAMHLADPLACYELVADELTVRTGHVVRCRECIPASFSDKRRAQEGVEATKAYNERVQDEARIAEARKDMRTAENAMHHGRRINAEDVKEREDAYSAAVDRLDQALGARNAPKVCDKTHDAVVSVSALALFEAGNVDQAWTLAQLDSGLHAEATKDAWIVWAKGALLRRKEA